MKHITSFFALLVLLLFTGLQSTPVYAQDAKPEIYYASPKAYRIAEIDVTGVDNYEDYVLIGLSGLQVGQTIKVPGDEITEALKRLWRHGLFSDVKILANKIEGSQIWLEIQLAPRPRISQINYVGFKKADREELETRIGLIVGNQITPNMSDRAVTLIKRYFDEKGYKNAEVEVLQTEDPSNPGQVILDIHGDRKDKIKVNQLIIDGNYALTDSKVNRTMKKTNAKGKWENFSERRNLLTKSLRTISWR